MRIVAFMAMAAPIATLAALLWRIKATGRMPGGAEGPSRAYALLFLLYGAVMVPLLGLLTPPYQVGDEIAHFQRADQVSLGDIVGYRSGSRSGGVVDRGIGLSAAPFRPLILHPDNKTRSADGVAIGWHEGKAFDQFENTSIYPPFFYALSALTIAAGKALDWSVLFTLSAARLVNGFAALSLGALAIALAGPASPWMFAVLALPMALSEMASASQDALMIPVAALAAGLFLSLLRRDERDRSVFAALCLALALIAAGRITQTALALLPLALHRFGLAMRIGGSLVVVAAGAGWSWLAARQALVPFGLPGADAHRQIQLLLSEPARVFDLMQNTLLYQWELYAESFVGKLGWLDLSLPPAYVELAFAELLVSLLLSSVVSVRRGCRSAALVTTAALAGGVALLFATLYVSWTPVGNFIVDGVQGRYFIPLAFFVPALIPANRGSPMSGVERLGHAAVLGFPLVTIPVTVIGVVKRYYLT